MSEHEWLYNAARRVYICRHCLLASREPGIVVMPCEAPRLHERSHTPRKRQAGAERAAQQNILAQIDWWHRRYACPCPQSHLKRSLGLDGGNLRMLLDWLADAGLVQLVASPYAGEPDAERKPAAPWSGQRYRFKAVRS